MIESLVKLTWMMLNLLAMMFLFWNESSMYHSATVDNFHSPCILIVVRFAPESSRRVAEEQRKQ